jgi:iron complex transport system permease protein
LIFLLFIIGLAALVLLGFSLGSVALSIPEIWAAMQGNPIEASHRMILFEIRIPRTLTALLCGAGLSLAGLLLQTLFRNPLAGPSVFGISSGASLGVALVMLTGITVHTAFGMSAVVFSALTGALVVVAIISWIARYQSDITIVLIAGLMLGFLGSALTGILAFFSDADRLKPFIHWGFGSFERMGIFQLEFLSIALVLSVITSLYWVKALNALLPGDQFAQSVGVSVKKVRVILIFTAGMITAIITAYTGPIGFIGLAVPQLTKMLFKTNHHGIILPASLLLGSSVAIVCDVIARVPGENFALPLNAVTALFGAPIVILVLFQSRKSAQVIQK